MTTFRLQSSLETFEAPKCLSRKSCLFEDVCLELSVWSSLFGAVCLELSAWSCLLGRVCLDLSVCPFGGGQKMQMRQATKRVQNTYETFVDRSLFGSAFLRRTERF